MDMAAILVNWAWPFVKTLNLASTEDSTWNLVETGLVVSKEEWFKDFIYEYSPGTKADQIYNLILLLRDKFWL